MSDLIPNKNGRIEICECSFTYNRKKHLITAGRRGGTQFVYKPEIFANKFEILKHDRSRELNKGWLFN